MNREEELRDRLNILEELLKNNIEYKDHLGPESASYLTLLRMIAKKEEWIQRIIMEL